VYRVLIGGSGGRGGGHLDWQVLRASQYVNPALRTEGQTDILLRHSPRYAYASRGNNAVFTLKL